MARVAEHENIGRLAHSMLSPPVAALRALELGRWGRDKRSVELVLARGGWRLEVGRKGAIDRVGVRVSAKAKEDER